MTVGASLQTTTPAAEPVTGNRLTRDYVRLIGRFAYLWAWPMVNIRSRLVTHERLLEAGLAGGVLPVAPPNQLAMLCDYIDASQHVMTCPDHDAVQGFGVLALNREPVVVQVPDFGDRVWLYHLGDQRTDSFAEIGRMHGTVPGLYLVVGPGWNGATPPSIARVLRSPTNLAYVVPRICMRDTAADRAALQPALNQVLAYPLSRSDGTMQAREWQRAPHLPALTRDANEINWVRPEMFFTELPKILDEVPPLPGEEAIYQVIRSMLAAAARNPALADVLTRTAHEADEELIEPLFDFRHFGVPLAHHWTTIGNGGEFGTDYATRTAVARAHMFAPRSTEVKQFYQDIDGAGTRLNGGARYAVTFRSGQLPPASGSWSLTLYNNGHFFHPNDLHRYSLGNSPGELNMDGDGSITVYVQMLPPDEGKRANWLPAPPGEFSLCLRLYWPDAAAVDGRWTPPAVVVARR